MADCGLVRSTVKKLATVIIVLLGCLLIAPTASGQPRETAVADFGGCLASQREGDLLLMIDESGSLQQSDPDAARVEAANYLLGQLASFGASAGVALDVAVAGFSSEFTMHAPWTRLEPGTLGELQSEVDAFRSRTSGLDTDYWLALDGARSALAEHSSGGSTSCQAIAWFSDGKLDFTARDGEKPYAPGLSLSTDEGVAQVVGAARESICRPAGVADQLRSSGIATFAVGLANGTAQAADFDLMRSIATGEPVAGQACGARTEPTPGDFYLAQNIDDLLFAFDAFSSPGQAPLENETGVCAYEVCEEAQHRFVLDDSIGSVTVLGFADAEGLVPTLVSPSGDELPMAYTAAESGSSVDGVAVDYRWLSDRSVSFTMEQPENAAGEWQGMWALVFVDPDGSEPAARSKSNIHISGNLFPALLGQDVTAIHAGEVTSAVRLGIVDSDREEIDPSELLGSAYLGVSLTDAAQVDHTLASGVSKDAIGEPIELDLTNVAPGEATLRLVLEVTTADATDESGSVIAPGTDLTPQYVDVPLNLAPPIGYPTVPGRIDFGQVEGAGTFPGELVIQGPGCVWVDPASPVRIDAIPDGVGNAALTVGGATSPDNCLTIEEGTSGTLPLELAVPEAGNGAFNGAVRLMIAPEGEPDRAMPVDVPFTADLLKPLDTTRFLLGFLAVFLLGVGIPFAILYALKWWASRIPAETLKSQSFLVRVSDGGLLRDGRPFTLNDNDLREIVRNLDKPARNLDVDGARLEAKMGMSPVGAGYVLVRAEGMLGASGATPATDRSTGQARLPLAVHNNWVLLHDPKGPVDEAVLLLLVGANASNERVRGLVDEAGRRAPRIIDDLRARAQGSDSNTPQNPTSPQPATAGAPASPFDPFTAPGTPSAPTFGAPPPFTGGPGFGGQPPTGPGSTPPGQPFDPFRPPGS